MRDCISRKRQSALDGPIRRSIARAMAAIRASAIAGPAIVSARALGREKVAAASERLTLGVIGIGPRCTYVLTSMLGLSDVRCVAITDVQKSRREAGKALVDKFSGNSDCVLYRDLREMLARKDIDAVYAGGIAAARCGDL